MSLRPTVLAAALACGALLALGQTAVQAQGPGGGMRPPGMGGGMRPGGTRGGGRMQMMVAALGLTPAQQTKLKPIMDAQRAQVMALRGSATLTDAQRGQKMQAIRKSYAPKIAAVLTPDQRKKMTAMMAQMRQRGPGGPGGPGGPAAPAAPTH